MRVIVTGASGFLGVSLINELLERGCEILAVVRPSSVNISRLPKSEKIQLIELDISKISELPKKVNGKYDVFYHLAWAGIRGKERNDKELQEKNFINSKRAVRAACAIGCKSFVSSGSQAECGVTNNVITEETPLAPVCEYGKAKVRSLIYEKNFCAEAGMRFLWVRIFSIYGIMDYEKSLINYALDRMLENKPVELSECTQLWDYMNVRDACKAILAAVGSDLSGIVNIASGNPRQLKQYVLDMKRIAASDSELLFGKIPTPEKGAVNLYPDASLLKQHTGFNAEIDFESGIRELIDFKLKGYK